jgi:ribonuclease HIII
VLQDLKVRLVHKELLEILVQLGQQDHKELKDRQAQQGLLVQLV